MFPNINKTKNPQRPTLAPNIARGAQTGSGGLTLTKFEVSKGRGPVTPTGPSYGMAATNFPSSSSSSGSTLLRRAKGKDERDVPRQRPNTPMPDNPVASAAAGGVVAHAAADPSGAPRGKEKAKRGRTTYKVTREDKDEPKHFDGEAAPVDVVPEEDVLRALEGPSRVVIYYFDEVVELSMDVPHDCDRILDLDNIRLFL